MDHEGITRESQLDFENWMMENGKEYDNDFTMKHRMQIYMKNRKTIHVIIFTYTQDHNRESHSDKYAANQFADMEDEELMLKMMMNKENLGTPPA